MVETFHLKVDDTAPRLDAVLENADDDPVDLTGGTVRLELRNPRGGVLHFDKSATIVDDAGGEVRYEWDEEDTATPGRYRAQFVVEYPDNDVETFPSEGFHDVVITPNTANEYN